MHLLIQSWTPLTPATGHGAPIDPTALAESVQCLFLSEIATIIRSSDHQTIMRQQKQVFCTKIGLMIVRRLLRELSCGGATIHRYLLALTLSFPLP